MFDNAFDLISETLPLLCKILCEFELIDEGLDENGAKIKTGKKTALCFPQSKSARIDNGKSITDNSEGEILFNGDIAPEIKKIVGGKATVLGVTHEVSRGEKARDFTGKVIFTRLLVK